jgi:membrane-bound lytic murein transglycosylase D
VDFWKRIYSEFGIGDFVLHDRSNLNVIYAVVRVNETTNERRAQIAARPEVERLRAMYEEILTRLAQGALPDELGPEGLSVFQAWGCPCPPVLLLRAAENIRVQQGLQQRVEEGLHRARALLPRILSILRRHDVPDELAALPMVESSFNPRAQSKAGAVGLWQFIRSTGKLYLTITRSRDDRRDPILATDAAARLLKHNYQALGSWPLAISAYNHGKEGIRAAKAAVGSSAIEDIVTQYTGPRFGFASRNFYAEFLAALEIVHPIIVAHASSDGYAQAPAPVRLTKVTATRPAKLKKAKAPRRVRVRMARLQVRH